MDICDTINFPVSAKKTFWVTTTLVFLGLLIDTMIQIICLPVEKVKKGAELLDEEKSGKNLWVPQFFGKSDFTG